MGWAGQMYLGSNDSQISPHMSTKFGRGLTVVLKKREVQRDRQTKGRCSDNK